MARTLTGLLCLGCVLFVSACGLLEAGPVVPPTPTKHSSTVVSEHYIKTVDNKYARLLGGRRFGDTTGGLLVTPHLALRQQSSGVVSEIGPGVAHRLGLSGAIKAPPGHELVVADFAQDADFHHFVPVGGHQPGSLAADKYRQWVKVGKARRRQVDADLTGGTLLIICAPKEARVRLDVQDGRRQRSLNLRTGRGIEDRHSDHYPGRDWSPAAREDGWPTAGLTDATPVQVAFSGVHAELSPFAPNGRWSKRGKAWLYVRLQVDVACPDVRSCRIKLVPKQELRLRLSGGGRPRPVGSVFRAGSARQVSSHQATGTVAFEVPASIKSAKVELSGAGRLVTGKKRTRAKWTHEPAPVTIRLDAR